MREKYLDSENHEKVRKTIERASRMLDAGTCRDSFRVPLWMKAAFLGAGLVTAPACQNKEEKIVPPEGIENVLRRPEELDRTNNAEPVDPAAADEKPLPPGTPPTRGADPKEFSLGFHSSITGKGNSKTPGNEGSMDSAKTMAPVISEGNLTYGAPPMGPPPPLVEFQDVKLLSGTLDTELVHYVLSLRNKEVLDCLSLEKEKYEKAAGILEVSFDVNDLGQAEKCEVRHHCLEHRFSNCLCRKLALWRFPVPENGRARVQASWILKKRIYPMLDF